MCVRLCISTTIFHRDYSLNLAHLSCVFLLLKTRNCTFSMEGMDFFPENVSFGNGLHFHRIYSNLFGIMRALALVLLMWALLNIISVHLESHISFKKCQWKGSTSSFKRWQKKYKNVHKQTTKVSKNRPGWFLAKLLWPIPKFEEKRRRPFICLHYL